MWTRTRNTIGAIAGVLLIVAANPLAGPMQSGAQTRRLDPRIGPAVPQRYESVLTAENWQNPYLVIGRDGVDVIVKRVFSGRRTVAASDLERTLIALPVTAWPYGRVAAVQASIGVPGRDDQPIADNLEATLAILKKLRITVDRWPN